MTRAEPETRAVTEATAAGGGPGINWARLWTEAATAWRFLEQEPRFGRERHQDAQQLEDGLGQDAALAVGHGAAREPEQWEQQWHIWGIL